MTITQCLMREGVITTSLTFPVICGCHFWSLDWRHLLNWMRHRSWLGYMERRDHSAGKAKQRRIKRMTRLVEDLKIWLEEKNTFTDFIHIDKKGIMLRDLLSLLHSSLIVSMKIKSILLLTTINNVNANIFHII